MYNSRRPPADKRLHYCGVSRSQAGCRCTWPPEQQDERGWTRTTKGGLVMAMRNCGPEESWEKNLVGLGRVPKMLSHFSEL